MVKVKGIRLNYENSAKINFESIKNLIVKNQDDHLDINEDEDDTIRITQDFIRRTEFHSVITKSETKKVKPVLTKRWFVQLDKSYPFGYKQN